MRNKTIVQLFFVVLLVLSTLIYGDIPEVQREALIALYDSTNGDNWKNKGGWKTPPLFTDYFAMPGTEKDWHGVTCDDNNTMVLEIDLHDNNLVGTIPAKIGDLSNLTYLDLSSNQLEGSIPSELGKLLNLTVLDLHSNQLAAIPPELGNLYSLRHLFLDKNLLTGSIPTTIGDLVNLEWLYLNENQLTGSIPPEIGCLVDLTRLYLNDNCLIGNIPWQLGDFSNLQYFTLNSNRLTGSIPSTMENLENLSPGGSDFRWNAIHTDNDSLRDFLNAKQRDGDWEGTQTVAPEGVSTSPNLLKVKRLKVSWDPIAYKEDDGGYLIFYSDTPGGPYTSNNSEKEDDKTSSEYEVRGLESGRIYYFVVQTYTKPHADNQNTVYSEYSTEVSGSTRGKILIKGKITGSPGIDVTGVKLTFSNNGEPVYSKPDGSYEHKVTSGWSGTVTPSKSGYCFFPTSWTYKPGKENSKVITVPDFKMERANPTISGTIKELEKKGEAPAPVHDVTLTFSNDGGSTTTDLKGHYSHTVNLGWSGTVTPEKKHFSFDPSQKPYNDPTNDNKTNQNYKCIPNVYNLSLKALLGEESTLVIKRRYGIITINIILVKDILLSDYKYEIYRKKKDGAYRKIGEVSEPKSGGDIDYPDKYCIPYTDTYYDKYLEDNITYTYQVKALAAGSVIAVSSEIKLQVPGRR